MYDWTSVHLLRKQGCTKDELQLFIVLHWQCAYFHNGFEFHNCHSFRIVTVSQLSQFQNCHSFRIVTVSQLSQFQNCHSFTIVTVSQLSQFQNCHSFTIVTVSELSQFQNCHSWRKTRLCHVEFKMIKHSNTTTTNTKTDCRWRYDG